MGGGRQARYYSIRVIFLIPFENTTPKWLDVTLESEMSLHNDILLVEDKETHLERVFRALKSNDETTATIENKEYEHDEDGLQQCTYFSMVSIDTYVRPYQLLTMLDHIEAGDDAVASVHA